jgi:hypothetical protein
MSIRALTHLARIDHDLIEPHLSTTLPVLFAVPPPQIAANDTAPVRCQDSASELLVALLDFHTRARAMPAYVKALLDSSEKLVVTADVYTTSLSSEALSSMHLEQLSKATANYLTPGQVMNTVDTLIDYLKRRWDTYLSVVVNTEPGAGSPNPDVAATAVSILCKVAATVLTSLPLKTVLPEVQANITHRLEEARTNIFNPALSKAIKRIGSNKTSKRLEAHDVRGWNIVTAAWLRFHYTLGTSRIGLGWDLAVGEKTSDRMRRVVGTKQSVSSEVMVECVSLHSSFPSLTIHSIIR